MTLKKHLHLHFHYFYSDPNHISESTMTYFKKCKLEVLEWPSHFPDLNITENLWEDLKDAGHVRQPMNIAGLAFCEQDWVKIPKRRTAGLLAPGS